MSIPEYSECAWGDLICGTKAMIQSYGLGIGRAFPGEPGGPARGRELRLRDPRGRCVRIVRLSRNGDLFSAAVKFGEQLAPGARPAHLQPLEPAVLVRFQEQCRAAARDTRFQISLARIVRNAAMQRTR